MIKKLRLLLLCHITIYTAFAQNVTISVNATQNKRLVSPAIYGRNQSFDNPDQFYKDAGLRFARIGGGNNMSAYNWRQKLTVHPDWFNNVYGSDWDVQAQKINDNFPNMQGMFAFQLLGRAASSGQHNFPDWNYMQAHPGWFGNNQNLAGDGTANPISSGPALVEGNKDLFSKPWPADSSVGILDHWFGAGGLGLNKNQFKYWSMDNEVDVWNGTHDWAMPTLISASAFMDRFIELAKKAKAIYPGIKICGPVTTSEWQWYKWSNESIWINGRYYCWLEYFIKRLGDEYKATGIKLLDVVDIHNYPWYNNDNAAALQLHRIYYDTTYDYPGSNGIYTSTGGWNTSLKKQYIFKRFNDWLNEHFGPNHGITAGLSEWSPGPNEPNLASVIYGSHLGTFANNGVDLFTPWNWFTGMWETLHLYSRNAKEYSVSSTSSDENMVSAYTTVNAVADSMTVIIVNRDMSSSRNVTVNLSGISVSNGIYQTLQLSSLPATETFISDDVNALKKNAIMIISNSFTVSVPALSTTAVLLKAQPVTLPITLLNFSGKENSSGHRMLNWEAVELNMSKYTIERGLDGKNFIDINSITAKNSSVGNSYSYTDSSYVDPTIKQLFYRLKMVGVNEAGQLSKTVLINLKSHESKTKIYPQPGSSAGITIEFVNSTGRSKDLVLMDALGNKIRSWHNYTAGKLFLSGLKAGVYLIKEINENAGNKTINKFVIQ